MSARNASTRDGSFSSSADMGDALPVGGPPGAGTLDFDALRRRGDRLVRLHLPEALPAHAEQIDGVLRRVHLREPRDALAVVNGELANDEPLLRGAEEEVG